MSRVRKLLSVGVVLAIGIGLAWPFRRVIPLDDSVEPSVGQSFPAFEELATPAPPVQARHIAAKMVSSGESPITPTRELTVPFSGESFDLANHPAIAKRPLANPRDRSGLGRPVLANSKKPTSRPAYAVADWSQTVPGEAESLQEIVHIVRNTDTLEKLAKRYLGDAGRALEIFDLNRDQLSNPHLLPIGAKLKIPAMADGASD